MIKINPSSKNLGNTCYMNAILQSLASLYPLATHFIMDKYKKEINKVNILGYKGRIADQFGLVMKGLWRGSFKYLRPDLFRREIAECKYEFASSKQQDAQELLLFLLDGLHEDLNQVKDRRYIEEKVFFKFIFRNNPFLRMQTDDQMMKWHRNHGKIIDV